MRNTEAPSGAIQTVPSFDYRQFWVVSEVAPARAIPFESLWGTGGNARELPHLPEGTDAPKQPCQHQFQEDRAPLNIVGCRPSALNLDFEARGSTLETLFLHRLWERPRFLLLPAWS